VTRLILLLLVAVVVVILLRAFRPALSEVPRTPKAASPRMSRAEALDVLGLAEGASREDILDAYKRLIRKVHPDAPGGSGYLASKLNQAKQTLLG
jgi:preprotein translocase subunit Sec63